MKGIWTYKNLIHEIDPQFRFTLGEGNTPLVRSKKIGAMLGLENLYFKLENLNPSGSYKDRFAAMAVANCLQNGNQAILATSSGNTGAALAAYAAAADIKCVICLVDGAPFGKVQQMGVYGAELLMIKGFGIQDKCTTDLMEILNELATTHAGSLEISAYKFSPIGMQGVQTIAFEIAEELPDLKHVFVPAGGGGLYLSMLLGFAKWKKQVCETLEPTIFCVQPEGNDTISSILKTDRSEPTAIPASTTKISGLQVPSLLDVHAIIKQTKINKCDGALVNDQDVYSFQKLLAQKEGIYCEPAGAVALAGLKTAIDDGKVNANDPTVCLITGNGFKDQSALNKIYTEHDCVYVDQFENSKNEILNKLLK